MRFFAQTEKKKFGKSIHILTFNACYLDVVNFVRTFPEILILYTTGLIAEGCGREIILVQRLTKMLSGDKLYG